MDYTSSYRYGERRSRRSRSPSPHEGYTSSSYKYTGRTSPSPWEDKPTSSYTSSSYKYGEQTTSAQEDKTEYPGLEYYQPYSEYFGKMQNKKLYTTGICTKISQGLQYMV